MADYASSIKDRLARPDCYGDPDVYDPENDDDCAYHCLHRAACGRVVGRKKGARILSKRSTRVPITRERKSTAKEYRNINIHPEESAGARLAKEMTASGLSAMGHEFGNFFDHGNFRFPFKPKSRSPKSDSEMLSCEDCGVSSLPAAKYCPGCGREFE